MSAPRRLLVPALALLVSIVIGGTRVRSDDPVSSSVRFTGEIVRIFDRKCLPCHGSGTISVPLTSYRDVRAWGRAIREEIVEQRMPPWTVARGYGRFRNELSLSAREMLTVLSWIDGGMPRGDDRDLPPPAQGTPRAAPDLRLPLPPQRVPAMADEVVRRVAVALPGDRDRAVARLVLAPGARQVLRGALIFEEGEDGRDARWLGAWLPWQPEIAPPAPDAFHLRHGARLTVELHYRGADEEVTDASAIEVYDAPGPSKAIDEVPVDGSSPARLARDGTVWAIAPSAGARAESLELKARRPDGSTDVLLWIPQLHREWPQALMLDRPLTLPAGTTVSLVTHPPDPAAHARLSLLR
jgi:hypothetical protein